MNKKVTFSIGTVIMVLIGGYVLYQTFFGKTALMTTYLEETEGITDEYLMLIQEEMDIDDPEELALFTEEKLILSLEQLVSQSEELRNNYSNEELLNVHAMLPQAFKLLIEANESWLLGNEDSDELFVAADESYLHYEKELEKLASKWGIEIVWEEIE
ncbi:hypothetical protein BpOF4_16405 [Alkalihalophilus pseudofirmus OF4]|uniref:Uncharacterized protein n=1 Tax=Alkalihalophilus pseudofirmus (strain ATCC BAA-2126 / JCM 17055 / OF4) TaxID=398511 RepID=D3FQ33_ALKPO|nr:hypothetical protein [Alkalihalophilus pseudofirmus]ADC51326.1 hypothetical protein BpOF4_16405 [Alkalihalophilus pseudofirmus OF4]